MTSPHRPDQDMQQAGAGQGAEALMRTMRMGFGMLGGLIALLLVIYLFSGMFYVEPNQEALVLHFGRISGEPGQQAVKSGTWRWAFPKPIDEIVRIPVRQSRTISSSQYWYKDTSSVMDNPSQAQTPPDGPLVPGNDGYLITGDGNILHAQWTLSYLVDDAAAFYSRYREPELAIRRAFDSAILAETASRKVDDALYAGSEALRLAVQERLIRRLGELDVGVAVQVVTFERKSPPRSTQSAFNRVVESEQEQSTRVSQANKYGNEVIQNAHGEASRMVAQAQSYRTRTVAEVEADVKYFNSLLPRYREAPETMLLTLYSETLMEVVARANRYVIHSRPGADQEVRIQIGPEKASPNTPNKTPAQP